MNTSSKKVGTGKALAIYEFILAAAEIAYGILFFFLIKGIDVNSENAFGAVVLLILFLPIFLIWFYPVTFLDMIFHVVYGIAVLKRAGQSSNPSKTLFVFSVIFRSLALISFTVCFLILLILNYILTRMASVALLGGILILFAAEIAVLAAQSSHRKKLRLSLT